MSLRALNLEELRKQLAANEEAPHDNEFIETIRSFIKITKITTAQMAEDLHVSIAVVRRWTHGKHLPYPTIRGSIYRYCARELSRLFPVD